MQGKCPSLAALFYLFLLLILGGCGGSGSVPLPYLTPDEVILAFGDSLTRGTGARAEESYPAVLETLSGRRVINAGIPGEVSASGAARLPRLLDEHRPDLLILCHGGNDLLRRLDPEQTAANLRTMIRAARQRDIPVVLVAVPEPGLWLESADYYARVAGEFGIPLEDEALAEIIGDAALKADRVHPNARGYRQLAEAIHQLLIDQGAL